MGMITVINNSQTAYQILISKNGSAYPDGQVTSGGVGANASTKLSVPDGDLYQVGFINSQDPNYKYGYNYTTNVNPTATVTITVTKS